MVDTINISYSTIYLLYPIALISVYVRNDKIGVEGIVPILREFTFNNTRAKAAPEYLLDISQPVEGRKGEARISSKPQSGNQVELTSVSPIYDHLTNS